MASLLSGKYLLEVCHRVEVWLEKLGRNSRRGRSCGPAPAGRRTSSGRSGRPPDRNRRSTRTGKTMRTLVTTMLMMLKEMRPRLATGGLNPSAVPLPVQFNVQLGSLVSFYLKKIINNFILMYKIRFLKSETRKYLQFQLIIHKVSALRIGTYLQKQN